MFSPDEIQQRIHQQPFTPLRIVTSAGQSFDVLHPDLIMVGRQSLVVGRASTENPAQYEQTTKIALLQVTSLEDLAAPIAPKQDGRS